MQLKKDYKLSTTMKGKVSPMQQEETVQIFSTNYKLISKKGIFTVKSLKRILALVIVAMMLVAIAIIPASAVEARRAPACDCGGTGALIKTSTGAWTKTTTTRVCTHFIYGYDIQYRQKITKTYLCDECGQSYIAYSYNYKWVCDGHG